MKKWTIRILHMPVRLALGLPPVYGLTVKCRALQLLRIAGLYRGRIDFVAHVRTVPIGLAGKGF